MKRREFLGKSLAASMALTPLTAFASNSNSRHLVAGAQDRASYMAKMLDTSARRLGLVPPAVRATIIRPN